MTRLRQGFTLTLLSLFVVSMFNIGVSLARSRQPIQPDISVSASKPTMD